MQNEVKSLLRNETYHFVANLPEKTKIRKVINEMMKKLSHAFKNFSKYYGRINAANQ